MTYSANINNMTLPGYNKSFQVDYEIPARFLNASGVNCDRCDKKRTQINADYYYPAIQYMEAKVNRGPFDWRGKVEDNIKYFDQNASTFIWYFEDDGKNLIS